MSGSQDHTVAADQDADSNARERTTIMKTRRLLFALGGLFVMGLPVLAGVYYYSRFAPKIDALAEAEQVLPHDCETLDRQLHQASMHVQPRNQLAMARADREEGVRLCARGAAKDGVHQLKAALASLGVRPKT